MKTSTALKSKSLLALALLIAAAAMVGGAPPVFHRISRPPEKVGTRIRDPRTIAPDVLPGQSPHGLEGIEWIGEYLPARPFGDGRAYVIALFAEWSEPSEEALQGLKKAASIVGEGVRFVHIGVFERTPGKNRAFAETLRRQVGGGQFVGIDSSGDKPTDGSLSVRERWLRAVGNDAVPQATIVDRFGCVVWSGHSLLLSRLASIEFLRRLAASPAPPAGYERQLRELRDRLSDQSEVQASLADAQRLAAQWESVPGALVGLSRALEAASGSRRDPKPLLGLARELADRAWEASSKADPTAAFARAEMSAKLHEVAGWERLSEFQSAFPVELQMTAFHGRMRDKLESLLPERPGADYWLRLAAEDPQLSPEKRRLARAAIGAYAAVKEAEQESMSEYSVIQALRSQGVIRVGSVEVAQRRAAAIAEFDRAVRAFEAAK